MLRYLCSGTILFSAGYCRSTDWVGCGFHVIRNPKFKPESWNPKGVWLLHHFKIHLQSVRRIFLPNSPRLTMGGGYSPGRTSAMGLRTSPKGTPVCFLISGLSGMVYMVDRTNRGPKSRYVFYVYCINLHKLFDNGFQRWLLDFLPSWFNCYNQKLNTQCRYAVA